MIALTQEQDAALVRIDLCFQRGLDMPDETPTEGEIYRANSAILRPHLSDYREDARHAPGFGC